MGHRGILLLACFFAGPTVADTLPANVNNLVLDPSTPATLYAAAGTSSADQGVYKSADGGLTWTRVFAMADPANSIAIDPLTPSTLYVTDAAANMASAVYKSTDGGVTWNAAGSGIQPKPGITPQQMDVIDSVTVDPVDEGVLYTVSANTGLYKSIDGGQSWSRINLGIPFQFGEVPYIPARLLVDPVVPSTLYYSFIVDSDTLVDGVYVSTDGGATWDTPTLGGAPVTGLALDPQDHLHLVTCFGAIYSSADGGATWTTPGASCGTTGEAELTIDPYYPAHILVASTYDKTIRSSTDGGATVGAAIASGLVFHSLVFDPQVPSNVYAPTTTSGLYISRDDGATWNPSGSAAARVALIHVPADQSTIQAGIDAAPVAADYVIVAPGTYTEQLDFKGKLITVKSSGGAAVTTLDGNDTGPIADFHTGESHAAVLQGFTLIHASNNPGAGSAILIAGASPSIEDDVFTANQEDNSTGAAISGSQTSALIVRDYFTTNTCGTNTTDAVITFTSDSSPIVADDVFANNACAAYAQTIAAATASQVYNDTFVGNTEALRLPGYTSTDTGVVFTQNIIAFNQVGVDTLSYSGTIPAFTFNLVYSNTTANYQGVADQTNLNYNISADPMLADWMKGDFHLLWGSPAFAAGNTPGFDSGIPIVVQASATDFYGQPRFLYDFGVPTVDLGAAEFYPPVITGLAGTLQVIPSTPQTGTLTASGTDPAGPLDFALVTPPAHGRVTISDPTTGSYQYSPAVGYLGTDSFTFDVMDPFGIVSGPATVQVTVADVAATANSGSVNTTPGAIVGGTLSATPAYSGQVLSFAIVTQPVHGTVSLTTGTGKFKYTPVHGYVGADSFTFDITDGYATVSGTATEQVTVNDVAPVTYNGSVHGQRNTAFSGMLTASVPDTVQAPTFSIVSNPANGNVNLNAATGAFTYTPSAGFAGADSFTFQVTDADSMTSNVATETVTIADAAPKAYPASITVTPNPYSGVLKGIAAYAGQTLTYAIHTNPTHGTLTLTDASTGAYIYRADPSYRGADSFTFQVVDQWGTVSNNYATVSIKIR